MEINKKRILKLNNKNFLKGSVLYWMSREQRIDDNWALLTAQKIAKENGIIVIFNLVPEFLEATIRQYDFMIKGLMELELRLNELNIPFKILLGNPVDTIPKFISENKIRCLITDFDPLKIKKMWKEQILQKMNIPVFEVDANNIVPCWIASEKQEYAAYTIRPKINRQLPEFLTEFPKIKKQKFIEKFQNDWHKIYQSITVNENVAVVDWIKPGEKSARETLKTFIDDKLNNYAIDRNDPNKKATSNLSIYLHFGQISAQRIALEIGKSEANETDKDAFLEELIVRNELADNFCYYNQNYDNPASFSNWAKMTIKAHEMDFREYVYAMNTFEDAETHDDLWNAAQKQLVKTGKMHGFMRMYWAKKILEWSPNVDDAMRIAIYLNDKYALDGRDPRGYNGIAWSIGGVHDRAWTERDVFGKIRYMNFNGCKRKFDVKAYIEKWE